jgi:hypothetical protein
MLRKLPIVALFSLSSWALNAQSAEAVYQFMDLPVSVSAAGVGGNSVSSPVNDLNLAFHNPALLSTDMHHSFSVGYMNYISDIQFGSAVYSRKINDRSAWMAGVRYIDYGSMVWTSAEDDILGETSAKDLALTGGYSWMLSEHWRAGGNISFIYSVLDEYTSAAVAVDLGVYYHSSSQLFSAGFVFKNLGAQIVAYDESYERMPWDIQLGVTQKLEHAPLRFTLTAQNLNASSLDYLAEAESTETTETSTSSFKEISQKVFKHVLLGVEFVPSDQFLLSLGYNYRRVSELSIDQRTPFGGFTAGFAFNVKNARVGASYAKYHAAGSSLQLTYGMNLQKVGL